MTGFYWRGRLAFFRICGYGLSILPPEQRPLFSERHGYRKPLLKIGGWRVFPLKPEATHAR